MGAVLGMVGLLAIAGQTRWWIPPDSQLGDAYAQTVKRLLGTHIGDPRGGKYMRVEVRLDGIGGRSYGEWKPSPRPFCVVEGWLLPGEPKRAVLWDGLVYPVVRVRGNADLERARKQSTSDARERLSFDPTTPGEHHRALFESANPVVPALWLLTGDVRTAERSAKQAGEALVPQLRP